MQYTFVFALAQAAVKVLQKYHKKELTAPLYSPATSAQSLLRATKLRGAGDEAVRSKDYSFAITHYIEALSTSHRTLSAFMIFTPITFRQSGLTPAPEGSAKDPLLLELTSQYSPTR